MANLIAYVAIRMYALTVMPIMTKEEIMKLRTPQWWEKQKTLRDVDTLLNLCNIMTKAICDLKPGQYIDVTKIKPENQELFYVVAVDHMMFNNDYIFSDDYGKLYRTQMDEKGYAFLTSAYR